LGAALVFGTQGATAKLMDVRDVDCVVDQQSVARATIN
jgi:hypothetical protein